MRGRFESTTQRPPHAASTDLVESYLRVAFPSAYIRGQKPLALTDSSEPEPDVAVVPGTARDYVKRHPERALLVVEVAEAFTYDCTTKASMYAKAGIAEYWIVNLVDRLLEIHREPGPMSEQPLGFSYRSVTRHHDGDTVAPLAAQHRLYRVTDLLP